MCRRILSAVMIALMLAGGSGVAGARGQQREAQEEEKITPDEESEAVRIAERFNKVFEEKNDFTPLIDELYVTDFDERLRKNPNRFTYLAKVEPEVVAKASDSELRRLYVASMNFMHAAVFLYGLNLYNNKLKGIEGRDEPPLGEVLPAEVRAMMKSDPLLAEVLAEDEETLGKSAGANEPGKETETGAEEKADGCEISSLERLRGFISVLEKVCGLLRGHLKTVEGPHTWKELFGALEGLGEFEEREEGGSGMSPRVLVLSEEFFGAPEGTRLICVDILPFHMDLVRVDGRLRVLTIYQLGSQ